MGKVDWLNLHISVLDSPQVLRCDPVRRATWLFLLRYCISQENGGIIARCAAWGDTSWQQIVRVRLREVRAESPLWTWEGDDLRVTFYPTEKETEVRALRELGKSRSPAKAAAARENGRHGGRKPNGEPNGVGSWNPTENPTENPRITQAEPIEGNGKERKGREVSAAAQPHAQEPTPPQPGLFDPEIGKPPGEPPAVTCMIDKRTFADWRIIVGKRIFWTRDEDATWRAMFDAEGWDEMTKGYQFLAKKHPPPKKIFLSLFQELRE